METAVIFVHHALEFLRKHRQYVASDEDMMVQLEFIIRNLQLVSEAAEGREVPPNVDGSRYDAAEERHLARITRSGNMREQVEDAIAESTAHWYEYIADSVPMETGRSQRMKSVINFVNVLTTDLRRGCEPAVRLFDEIMGVSYVRQAFPVYEKEATEMARDLAVSTSDRLRPIVYDGAVDDDEVEKSAVGETINVGTTLFELYLALQHMAEYGVSNTIVCSRYYLAIFSASDERYTKQTHPLNRPSLWTTTRGSTRL